MSTDKKRLWIFDLDGVLIHLEKKEVTEKKLFPALIKLLQRGDLIGINTGRSMPFIEREIVKPLMTKILIRHLADQNDKEKIQEDEKNLLQNIFVVAEKGGVWASIIASLNSRRSGTSSASKLDSSEVHPSGQRSWTSKDDDKEKLFQVDVDPALSMPQNLIAFVRKVIKEKFANTMEFDETKRTMISTESKKGAALSDFQKEQKKLIAAIKAYMQDKGLFATYTIEPSASATDIQDKRVGKHLGAIRILQWLKSTRQKPAAITCFGDSPGDFKMAEELFTNGFPVTFVYTHMDAVTKNYSFKVVKTRSRGEKGTLEYLKHLV